MKKEEFDFELPEELIAQIPLENREDSKLLLLNKNTKEIEHRKFYDIIDYLNSGDTLVLNNTKVIPARIYGKKKDTSGRLEILLLRHLGDNRWETLVKPGKKLKIGGKIEFERDDIEGELESILENGNRIIKFKVDGNFSDIIESLGEMPTPPYITEKLQDKNRYQTVFAQKEGSAAAPTAGLHFTKELLKKIIDKGVNIVYITLHVGLGTFRPVKSKDIKDHHMHTEYYEITNEVANTINETKKNGKKIIAVGTTSVRTLESSAIKHGEVIGEKNNTDIFIYPGYKFKVIDNIITNFHLPESTLIMLVSAMAGKKETMDAYSMAVKNRYRFFSFGDAMFIYD